MACVAFGKLFVQRLALPGIIRGPEAERSEEERTEQEEPCFLNRCRLGLCPGGSSGRGRVPDGGPESPLLPLERFLGCEGWSKAGVPRECHFLDRNMASTKDVWW